MDDDLSNERGEGQGGLGNEVLDYTPGSLEGEHASCESLSHWLSGPSGGDT